MTPQRPRILLAASGSAASRQAAVVAADLASTFNAQLTILHVAAPVVIATLVGELGADLLVIGSTPRLVPSAWSARTRKSIQAHVACPVLPVKTTPPTRARPAGEPVLAV